MTGERRLTIIPADRSQRDKLEELDAEILEVGEPGDGGAAYDVLRRLLTDERYRLIRHIADNDISSKSELVDELGRDTKSVYRDLKLLEENPNSDVEGLGILRYEQVGRCQRPLFNYDSVEIDLYLGEDLPEPEEVVGDVLYVVNPEPPNREHGTVYV